MLRSQECLTADDVTVRCHVRHWEEGSQTSIASSSQPQESMTCTMRVWRKTKNPDPSSVVRKVGTSSQHNQRVGSFEFASSGKTRYVLDEHGPELLLTPNEIQAAAMIPACCSGEFASPISMSNRYASFGSRTRNVTAMSGGNGQRSSSRPRPRNSTPLGGRPPAPVKTLGDVTMKISDICLIDLEQTGKHQCRINTRKNGYFELTMENRNGKDVLLAFLKANMPSSKFVENSLGSRTASGLSKGSASTGAKSFDVEAFTANRMTERMKNETISEKLRRKVARVFSSFEEMSASITDCACGCAKDSVSPAPDGPIHTEKRDAPPSYFENLETAPDRTPISTKREFASEEMIDRRDVYKRCSLPSGLSVEYSEDIESESGAH